MGHPLLVHQVRLLITLMENACIQTQTNTHANKDIYRNMQTQTYQFRLLITLMENVCTQTQTNTHANKDIYRNMQTQIHRLRLLREDRYGVKYRSFWDEKTNK